MKLLSLLVLGLTAACTGPRLLPAQQDGARLSSHRALTFNIRYGSADDGPDRWERRREGAVETIRDLDADVVGLQEAESFQVRELLAALPRYAAVGVHRDDGRLAGESTPVLYDRRRYTLAAAGTFWLSDTPEVAGSNTWGAACNRTCTWVRLVDLSSGEDLTVYNAHFDHESQPARERSSALIVRRAAARPEAGPFLVIGDLNANESNPALAALLAGTASWNLRDAYRLCHPDARAGTFTGFDLDSDGGTSKIDHVLAGPGVKVLGADIDRRRINGRYPSDHFPVWADVALAED